MREKLAIRGLGYLQYLCLGRKGIRVKMENATLPLMGLRLLIQGFFERTLRVESEMDRELTEDGDLLIEVAPL